MNEEIILVVIAITIIGGIFTLAAVLSDYLDRRDAEKHWLDRYK